MHIGTWIWKKRKLIKKEGFNMHSFEIVMPDFAEKGRIVIELPFNVWDTFQQKGAMRASGTINEVEYNCSLIPRGKGIYLLPVNRKIITKAEIKPGDKLLIKMRIGEKETVESCRSLKKGSRKIESINYVKEPNPSACGQACIAMIAGVGIEEVFKVMKTKGPTTIGQLLEALDHYQIGYSTNKRISKKNPKPSDISILTVQMPNYSHWVLYFKGKYYDPEFGVLGECHPEGRITSFLEIMST